MDKRKPDSGVYPPDIDVNDLVERLEYIASYFDGLYSPYGKEYALTIREGIVAIGSVKSTGG